jgi:zinc protease
MKVRTWFLAPALASVTLSLAAAASAQAPLPELPVDPQVTMGTLPNGLRYYIRENRRPEQRAELRLVVNAGSILEDEDQLGLAHFVEHMAFNGTRNFEKQELVSWLESIGMRFGADVNAYTSFDETVYMLQVPTDSLQPIEKALQILEDWAHGVSFDPEEVEKERGVVIEEWRLGQGAGERLRQQYFPTLFRGSRYAERLPIGTPDVLRTFTREQLVRFYRDWYRPDLMAVVAVGDFEAAVVEQLVIERFGRIEPVASPRARETFSVPDHAETLVVVATDEEATGTVVEASWKLPPHGQETEDDYRRSLLQQLYGRMLNARLGELAQKPEPPFIAGGSTYGSMIRSRASFSLGAMVQDGGVEPGLEAVLAEAERVARHGFTATELERQKTNLLRGMERAWAERSRTESSRYAAEYVRAYLEGEPIPGIEYEYELVQRLLPGITLDEVNALSAELMPDGNRVVIVTAPKRDDAALPTRQSILAVFDRVAANAVAAYEDAVPDEALMPTEPAAGRIVSTTAVPGIDAMLLQLSNGARVYLKPTDFKHDQVLLGSYSPGGLSLVPDSLYPSATFAAQLVAISGLGAFDAVQLQKALTGKAASVRAVPGEYSESVSGTASPQDIETMFQLVHLHFTAPRNDSSAYESFMTRYRAALANRNADPGAAFQDTLQLTLWQRHPRAQPVSAERLDQVDRATAFRIYQDRFADAGDFTFVLVGAFDPEQVGPLIERYIASLPADGRVDTPRDNGMRPVRGVIDKVVRRGLEDRAETRITFTGDFEYSREHRLDMALLADVLEMRLRDVLREDLGGTYGAGVSQSTHRFPEGLYTFSIGFGSAPDRVEELVQVVFAELERLKTEGPDPDALGRAREQQRRSFETNVKRNEYWLSVLLREAETGEPARDVLDFPQRLQAVTPERVRDAARRWLDTDNYLRVTLLPER